MAVNTNIDNGNGHAEPPAPLEKIGGRGILPPAMSGLGNRSGNSLALTDVNKIYASFATVGESGKMAAKSPYLATIATVKSMIQLDKNGRMPEKWIAAIRACASKHSVSIAMKAMANTVNARASEKAVFSAKGITGNGPEILGKVTVNSDRPYTLEEQKKAVGEVQLDFMAKATSLCEAGEKAHGLGLWDAERKEIALKVGRDLIERHAAFKAYAVKLDRPVSNLTFEGVVGDVLERYMNKKVKQLTNGKKVAKSKK
jgi:hypothetical protein